MTLMQENLKNKSITKAEKIMVEILGYSFPGKCFCEDIIQDLNAKKNQNSIKNNHKKQSFNINQAKTRTITHQSKTQSNTINQKQSTKHNKKQLSKTINITINHNHQGHSKT